MFCSFDVAEIDSHSTHKALPASDISLLWKDKRSSWSRQYTREPINHKFDRRKRRILHDIKQNSKMGSLLRGQRALSHAIDFKAP
jgi:hypothetical protein